MYGCFDPNLVYGFNIGDRQHIIDPDYLEEDFPDILQCATDVVKHHLGEAVYGITCSLNPENGKVDIIDYNLEKVDKVNKLYEKYIEYLKTKMPECIMNNRLKKIKLGYHLVVLGDYELCHEKIMLSK